MIDYDLRRNFTAHQKANIARLYQRTETFDRPEYKPLVVKKDTGDRFRIKNTIFVSTEGADTIRYNPRKNSVTKTWREKTRSGKTLVKRSRVPLNPKPEELEAQFRRWSRVRHGKRDYFMVRTRGASGDSATRVMMTLQELDRYKVDFRAGFLARERARLRRSGMRGADVDRTARRNANEVIESWQIQEYDYEEGE